ncbi:hypothetical protein GF337_20180 [candidate division KSB1 bacterium]|nr:hypothetical protein [candidate division KSB1 bacterium]
MELDGDSVIQNLTQKHGEEHAARIEQGVQQVARFWRQSDGSQDDFAAFCEEQFITDPEKLDHTLQRFETHLEQIFGLNLAMNRELMRPIHVDIGPIYPVDMLFAEYNPFAHLEEDFFKTKVAFAALLNFPLYSLEEMLEKGVDWSRKEWAQARLVQQFSQRVPAEVKQRRSEAYVKADHYISNYNIYMGHLVTPEGERLFPEDLKLITHWGLRDELKAQYANPEGLTRQRMIQTVMERIIRQKIPAIVIDNQNVDWDPLNNTVTTADTQNAEQDVSASAEDNVRYQHLLNIFKAEQMADPYYPGMPTKMARRFQDDREIPEEQFEQLLISVLSAPVAKDIGALIRQRLGRDLEPFDIWYDGFKARSQMNVEKLDQVVSSRYPDTKAFDNDLPFILRNLGFRPETAEFLASKVEVDPSRGAGHAYGAAMRSDNAHLRTRVAEGGMNYKAYNIAIHELGHNVEQVFSLNRIDHIILQGVPNTAFTEGFAFVFQSRDLELLGMGKKDPQQELLKVLDTYWSTFEISGVALVDMYVWNWMYDNPDASPEQLNEAVQNIAKDVWNKYYAPVLGMKDQILLGVYSHMIDAGLYLPDYPLGHIIAFQIEEYFKDKDLAQEMERMCKLGSITPSAWMQAAVGAPISSEPLISATEKAVQSLK